MAGFRHCSSGTIALSVTGAPIMISFPHFYLGDPSLLETVEGLKPDPEKHDGYLDVHEVSELDFLSYRKKFCSYMKRQTYVQKK
jgi:hypothetical protein